MDWNGNKVKVKGERAVDRTSGQNRSITIIGRAPALLPSTPNTRQAEAHLTVFGFTGAPELLAGEAFCDTCRYGHFKLLALIGFHHEQDPTNEPNESDKAIQRAHQPESPEAYTCPKNNPNRDADLG